MQERRWEGRREGGHRMEGRVQGRMKEGRVEKGCRVLEGPGECEYVLLSVCRWCGTHAAFMIKAVGLGGSDQAFIF